MGALAVVGLGLAAFSAPNTSAIMGSVRRDQLGVASAFLATMRVTGQALSVAVLGGIAASRSVRWAGGCCSPTAGRRRLAHGVSRAADQYARGYTYAMATRAALAVVGAALTDPWRSRARGPAGRVISRRRSPASKGTAG